MAHRLAVANGNHSTAANWYQGTNTPSISGTSNVTVTTSGVFSVAYTAPNTTNKATAVNIYLVSKGSAGSITATLQESTVDTACTVTIDLDDVIEGQWMCFFVPTPYTFTTTAASAYRWKFTTDTNTATVSQASGAGSVATVAFDDRTGVPVNNDNIWILKENGLTARSMTMDGSQTIGTGNTPGLARAVNLAAYIGDGCELQMDTAVSVDLAIRGDIWVAAGGELSCATTSSPLSSSNTVQVRATGNNSTIYYEDGAIGVWQGAPKTYQRTTVVSGDGSTGSPLVTADAVDWSVGDEVIFAPATDSGTNYNEAEVKFIRVKNSSTSYTLAATSGGAESALTYSHVGGMVGNFTNNITIKGNNSSNLFIGFNVTNQTTPGNIDIDWVRFENMSSSTFLGALATKSVNIGNNANLDNCVGKNGGAGFFLFNSNTDMTHTNLLTYNTLTSVGLVPAISDITLYSSNRSTLENCYSLSSNGFGIGVSSSFSCTIQDSKAYGCTNISANSAGIAVASSGLNNFIRVGSHAHYANGIYIDSGPDNIFTDCEIGTDAAVPNGIYMGTGYSTALFNNLLTNATTLMANYANMTLGSEIAFQRLEDTDNNHRWYTVYGYGMTEDTVIRSPGLSVKLVPENLTTGFTWSFQIPLRANSIAGFRGYFLKNATLGSSVVTISLFLPGSTVADSSVTLDSTTGASFSDANEQSVAIQADYTGDDPGVATVTINVKSNTAGAFLYADDFFNAGDRTTTYDSVTGLNTWVDGKPLSVLSPQTVSTDDFVKTLLDTVLTPYTVTNSVGKTLTDAKKKANIAANS